MSFDAIIQDHLRHAHDRVEALRRERSKEAAPPPLAEDALQELFTAMEELQVTEEELRQQNESLAAAQLLLEEENQRYVDLFHVAPDAYLVTTADATIREANDAAGALLGVAPTRLRGKPLSLFVARECIRQFRERVNWLAASAERMDDWELVMAPRGGAGVPVSCTVTCAPARAGEAAGLRWIVRDISARLAAEETERRLASERAARAIAEAGERRLRGILESITDAFVTLDREWRFTYLNPRATEYAAAILGVPGPFEGRVVWDILPTGAEGSRQVATLRAAMEDGARAEFEVRIESTGRWFNFRVHPMEEGLTLYFTDVSEKRQADEERLRLHREAERQRAFLDTVMRQMPNGVAIAEAPHGRIILHNPVADRIFGQPLTAGEVAEYAAHGLLRDDGTPLPADEYPLARALRGETLTDEEIPLARADGAARTLQVSAAPVREEDGTATAAVLTFQDATDRRRRTVADQLLARASEILSSSLESAATLQAVADLAAGSMADYCIVHVEA
ncbi:MAG TPA: PAS domain-containing protein, partial [Longimicrobium sp.]